MDELEQYRRRRAVRHQSLRRLGVKNVRCICGEDDPVCFEADHIYRRELDSACWGTLKLIARELAESIKRKATLDWTQRDTVRADMRRTVRRLLAKYGYPPDAQESATQLVIRQAELTAEQRI